MSFRELVWPVLERDPVQEAQTAVDVEGRVTQIRARSWGNDAQLVLAEGQRLAEAEAERRRSADNKAAVYLAAVAAIVPLLASTETVFFDNTPGSSAPPLMTAALLVIALVYLSTTALWAARTLRVTAVRRVDVETILESQPAGDLSAHLASENLVAAIRNRAVANDKITKLKMTHEFMLRAAVTFTAALTLEAAWAPALNIGRWIFCR